MTYSSGSLISASDYNGFATSVNGVWNTLWGQSSIGSVATGGTVTAAQWSTLASTITNAYTHESGSNPSVASPSAGSTIGIITNLSTAVTYITGHQYDCYASGTVYNTSGSATGPAKGSANTSWTMTFTNTIVFSSTAARDYFFKAGGRVLLNFSKSSTGLPADSAWNALAAACNQISLTSDSSSKVIAGTTYQGTNKQGGSGSPSNVAVSIGYNQLTASQQQIFLQYSSTYPYGNDYIGVNAFLNGNNVVFYTTWFAASQPTPSENQSISAGAVTAISYYPPETTYISNTWGTPTLSASVV